MGEVQKWPRPQRSLGSATSIQEKHAQRKHCDYQPSGFLPPKPLAFISRRLAFIHWPQVPNDSTGFQAIPRLGLENSGKATWDHKRQIWPGHQANGILLFSKKGVACERRIKVSNGVFEDLILADAWHRNGNSEPISEGFPGGLEGCITLWYFVYTTELY